MKHSREPHMNPPIDPDLARRIVALMDREKRVTKCPCCNGGRPSLCLSERKKL